MKHTPKFQETPIKFSELTRLEKLADNYIHLGEDYILTKMTSSNAKFEEPVARRFDGMTICACVKGVLRMMINDTEVTVNPDSLLFIHPDAVFNSIDWSGDEQEAYLLFLSNRFIHDINIDLNAINTNLFTTGRYVIPLDKEKIIHLLRYFEMLHMNASQQNNYNRYIARALVSAAGYQIMAFAEEASENDELASKQSRKFAYAQKFLRLVREFYRSQRSISFYAEKMFISPKYLSLVIKEATGKSAGDWIDQYVIQEAKNQLRFSGKNVQQIAYDLNFSNQSSFGKYFKNLTGMSPTAFQNKDGMR